MTSISALTCNVKEGPQIWISDDLETLGDIRQSSICDKLYHIGNMPYCLGGAGSSPMIKRTVEDIYKLVDKSEFGYAKDLEDAIRNTYISDFQDMKEELVMKPNGTNWEEWKRGGICNSTLNGKINQDLSRFEDHFKSRFIGGGKLSKDDEYRLTQIDAINVIGEQYFCVGSGTIRADAVISDYLERMKSEQRKSISAPLGTRILIEAAQSARSMPGVGGTGQIVYLNEEFHQLKSDEVRLLHNMVFDEKTGLIEREFVDKTIADVIGNTTEVADVLKALESKIDQKKLLKEHYTGRLQRF